MPTPWYQRPESVTAEEATEILSDLANAKLFPKQFREVQKFASSILQTTLDEHKRTNPIAFVTPSYEQALKMNAWWGGITWIIDFDANRIGKTATTIFNALFYILPNDPETMPFQPHTDHIGRSYRLLPRPSIQNILRIQDFFAAHPELEPNLDRPFDDPHNKPIFDQIPPEFLKPAWPLPPVVPPAYQNNALTIWHGAPTSGTHKETVIPEWKKWLPHHVIEKVSEHEQFFSLSVPHPHRDRPIKWVIQCKSYDAADTTWASNAADAIILTEGPPRSVLNEVKQRFKDTAFAAWDYTPYESRNTGHKTKIAHDVYKGKEQLPLRTHVFSGFGIKNTPTYIMSDRKRGDLLRTWADSPEGKARIHGEFYASSPKALKKMSEPVHYIEKFTFQDLWRKYSGRLRLYRGLDPGWAHLCSCTWAALTPLNEWFIYQGYTSTERSIEERCEDIIKASGNYRVRIPSKSPIPVYREQARSPQSHYQATFCDHHTWKVDETTKLPFAFHYIRNGLVITKSIGIGPKERATLFDQKLQPTRALPHPTKAGYPGARVYFLVDEPGVSAIWAELDNLFWETYEQGEKKGLTKETLQDYDDDRFDSTSYLVASSHTYNRTTTPTDAGRELERQYEMIADAYSKQIYRQNAATPA